MDAPGGRSDGIRALLAKGKGFPIRPTLGPINVNNAAPYDAWLHADVVVRFIPECVNLCEIGVGILETVCSSGALPVHFTGENGDAG